MRFGVFLRLSPSVGVALANRHGCGSAPRSPHPAAGLVTPCRQSLRTRLSLAPAAFASLRFRMWGFPLFRTPSGDRRHCHSRDPSRMPTPHFIWVPSASAARPLRCYTSRRHPTQPVSCEIPVVRVHASARASRVAAVYSCTCAPVSTPAEPNGAGAGRLRVAGGLPRFVGGLPGWIRYRWESATFTEHGKRSPLAIL